MDNIEEKGRKVAIDIVKANVFAVVIMVVSAILFLVPFFIAAAAGDIWMTWLLTKENPKSLVLDHPSEAGFYIIDED